MNSKKKHLQITWPYGTLSPRPQLSSALAVVETAYLLLRPASLTYSSSSPWLPRGSMLCWIHECQRHSSGDVVSSKWMSLCPVVGHDIWKEGWMDDGRLSE